VAGPFRERRRHGFCVAGTVASNAVIRFNQTVTITVTSCQLGRQGDIDG
jgi:hypothetical protein